MSVVPDFPDWSPHVATADQVAATGVPLLTLSTELGNVSQNISPSSSGSIGTFAFTQIGYEIMVVAAIAPAATNPFPTVLLEWTDTASNTVVATDTFTATASGAAISPVITIGRGFTKANSVQVTVNNYDTVQTLKVNVAMYQNSRVYPKDEFFWLSQYGLGLTVPGFTLATLPPDENCLGIISNTTIAASSNITRLFGPYNGPLIVGMTMHTGSLSSINVNFSPAPDNLYGGVNELYGATPTSVSWFIAGPRAPIKCLINNNATTAVRLSLSVFRFS